MANEPEYLRKIREAQAQKDGRAAAGGGKASAALSIQEKEALKWAREVAGTDLRSQKGLAGAKYALLYKVAGASGVSHVSLEGTASKDAFVERIKNGLMMGEEIVGGYEVRGGRPAGVAVVDSEVTIKMGAPRPGANPLPPEKMLRQAAAAAAELAKRRPAGDDRGRGGQGGGSGRGR
ncbi:MAG: hypothetical protein SGI84_08325 [Gemmatimonadota bacterium]|nr:hypothetical protein [Gemmatimonadota bacterium]